MNLKDIVGGKKVKPDAQKARRNEHPRKEEFIHISSASAMSAEVL